MARKFLASSASDYFGLVGPFTRNVFVVELSVTRSMLRPNRLNLSNAQLAPLIVGCALLMEMLDSTIISTALPVIAR
ncbi:MAG TPA: hypothetical protein VMT64_01545, partial [Candidatus Binataceae bacterium]|nr:hypothetical protein [Candidatus Binataceae bacterium]